VPPPPPESPSTLPSADQSPPSTSKPDRNQTAGESTAKPVQAAPRASAGRAGKKSDEEEHGF
jgi:hypothetical protein